MLLMTPLNKEVFQAAGTVAVALWLAEQTTAFRQAEVERPAVILVMSLPEQVLVGLPQVDIIIDVLLQVASHKTNPDLPKLPLAQLVDLLVNQRQHQAHVKAQAHSSKQDPALSQVQHRQYSRLHLSMLAKDSKAQRAQASHMRSNDGSNCPRTGKGSHLTGYGSWKVTLKIYKEAFLRPLQCRARLRTCLRQAPTYSMR